MKRYYVYDYVLGNPVLVDRKEKTVVFYNHNIYGQVSNLVSGGDSQKISAAKINGLIKRLNGRNYFENAYVLDSYIFHLLMTEEQKAKCKRMPTEMKVEDLYGSSDDFSEAITLMCEKVYEKTYAWQTGKEERKEELTAYYVDFLKGLTSASA